MEQVEEYIHKDETEGEVDNGVIEPSERQKAYLLGLARNVGLKMDITRVRDRQEASVLIERLKVAGQTDERARRPWRDARQAGSIWYGNDAPVQAIQRRAERPDQVKAVLE